MKSSTPSPKGNPRPRPQPESPSWVAERVALREYGDRKTRAILAVFLARRSAHKEIFFVAPSIAQLHNLSASDLNWALDRLEGDVLETRESRRGKFRTIRLLPRFEEEVVVVEGIRRGRRRPRRPDNVTLGEERVYFNKEQMLARISSPERESAPRVLETLRAIATESKASSGSGA